MTDILPEADGDTLHLPEKAGDYLDHNGRLYTFSHMQQGGAVYRLMPVMAPVYRTITVTKPPTLDDSRSVLIYGKTPAETERIYSIAPHELPEGAVTVPERPHGTVTIEDRHYRMMKPTVTCGGFYVLLPVD